MQTWGSKIQNILLMSLMGGPPYTAVVRGHWCDATASGDKIAGRHFLAALHYSLEFYGKNRSPSWSFLEDRHI